MTKSTIKVPANQALLGDVQRLRELLGATSMAEAMRRAVMRELLLLEALQDAKQIIIKGRDPQGDTINVIM